jgi:DNA-directed RNA polymerase subunit RPC12/RpoP
MLEPACTKSNKQNADVRRYPVVACPYCHQPAMTIWEKLKTGPRHELACRSCGRKISVSKSAILAVIVPVTIGAFVAHTSASLTLGAGAILTGGAVAILVYIFSIPIVGRDA